MKTAVVKGKVTYKGKAVSSGTVFFMPANGPTAQGALKPDGTFELKTYKEGDGAVLGKHNVFIVAMQDTSNVLPDQQNPLPPPTIPDKYTSSATSDLTATVEDKENVVNFDLVGELGNKK